MFPVFFEEPAVKALDMRTSLCSGYATYLSSKLGAGEFSRDTGESNMREENDDFRRCQ